MHLRKLFNLQTLEEKFEEYKKLEETLELKKSEFNSIVNDYFSFKKRCENQIFSLNNKIIKANGNEKEEFSFIKEKIVSKYNNYLSEYLDKCIIYKKDFDNLEKSINEIIKKNIELIDKDKTNFIETILTLSKAHENGEITPELYQQSQLKIFEIAAKKNYDIISLLKSYTVGTIREWKGGKFQKTFNGWEKVKETKDINIEEFENDIKKLFQMEKINKDYDSSLQLRIKQKNLTLDLLKYEQSVGKIKGDIIFGMKEVEDRYNKIINKNDSK